MIHSSDFQYISLCFQHKQIQDGRSKMADVILMHFYTKLGLVSYSEVFRGRWCRIGYRNSEIDRSNMAHLRWLMIIQQYWIKSGKIGYTWFFRPIWAKLYNILSFTCAILDWVVLKIQWMGRDERRCNHPESNLTWSYSLLLNF